jgi:carbohydrate kinase (thermoresistant glucokinase family)
MMSEERTSIEGRAGGPLAGRLQWEFEDGDWVHPAANVDKMHRGIPLTDDDRAPWLRSIRAWIDRTSAAGRHGVIACSALKRRYREALIGDGARTRLVFLKGSEELIARRIATRHEHFMPPSLLHSQFVALEEPGPDEIPIVVSIERARTPVYFVLQSESGGLAWKSWTGHWPISRRYEASWRAAPSFAATGR